MFAPKVTVKNPPVWLVLSIMVLQLVLFFWTIYFFVKAAAHVGAWPF